MIMLMTLMMTVMTSNNNDDDHVHRLSVGRTLLLLVAGLLLHCLANLDKILNIFPLLLSPHLDDFRIFHDHENLYLLRHVLDHSGALRHAVSGASLLRHHVVCQLGISSISLA